MKILCIGSISYDITFPISNFPEENKKIRVDKRIECGGGNASNAAYLLGKWGMEVYLAGHIGNDYYGHKVIDELKSANVNTKYVETSNDSSTITSFIINNTSNGSRTILSYHENDLYFDELNLDFEPDIILVDSREIKGANIVLDKYPNAISVMDAEKTTDESINLAKRVDYLVCSKEFAEKVTGINIDYNDEKTILDLYNKMEDEFKGHIIITLESHGVLYKQNNNIGIMDALKVKAIDSTGAGDIFHGAFIYGISKKYDLNLSLTIATVAGGISVTKIGGRNSIPTKEEMRKYIHDFE